MFRMLPTGELVPLLGDLKRVSLTPIRSHGESLKMFYESNDESKGMHVRLNNRESFVLRRYMVCCFFDIPSIEAARIMCISLSLLKRIRSWAKVRCWPCSQIHSRDHPHFTREWVVQRRDEVIAELETQFLQTPGSMLALAIRVLKEVRQYAQTYLCLVIPGVGRRNALGDEKGRKSLITSESESNDGKNYDAKFGSGGAEFKAEMKPGVGSAEADVPVKTASDESGGIGSGLKSILAAMQPVPVVKKRKVSSDSSKVTVIEMMRDNGSDKITGGEAGIGETQAGEDTGESVFWPVARMQECHACYYADALYGTGDDGLGDGLGDELGLGPVSIESHGEI